MLYIKLNQDCPFSIVSVKKYQQSTMTTTKNILECVQRLPCELIREIKDCLDPETQIDLLKNKPSVYENVKKTVNKQYVKVYLKEPSIRALCRALKKQRTKIMYTIQDEFGFSQNESYHVDCELPGNVIANMYETNIHKPMLKALEKAEEDAPTVVDLNGQTKPCVTPLEKNIISRFKIMDAPVKPIYTNERTHMRHTRALNDYYDLLPRKVYELLQDFGNCASFNKDLIYAIRMSSLKFLKTLIILSKQYVQSPIDALLSKRTAEDIAIDRNRYAYYAKNKRIVKEAEERENMFNEMTYMNNLIAQEAKIKEKHEKEERKLVREETKTKKLQEKEEKMRLREERANKKAQQDQEKALRAVLREQARAKKLKEKLQKETELVEKYTYKMLRTMFV